MAKRQIKLLPWTLIRSWRDKNFFNQRKIRRRTSLIILQLGKRTASKWIPIWRRAMSNGVRCPRRPIFSSDFFSSRCFDRQISQFHARCFLFFSSFIFKSQPGACIDLRIFSSSSFAQNSFLLLLCLCCLLNYQCERKKRTGKRIEFSF